MAPKSHRTLYFLLVWVVSSLLIGGCTGDERAESPDERLRLGLAAIDGFDFERANLQLEGISDEFEKGSEAWAQAAYLEAVAARHVLPIQKERLERARFLLQEIAELENEPLAPVAWIDLGRIAALQLNPDDPEIARKYYREVVERWPNSMEAGMAVTWLANSYLTNERDADQAATVLRNRLERFPDGPGAAVHWHRLSMIEMDFRGDHRAALDALEKADQLGFPQQTKKDTYLYTMALLAENLNQPGKAAEYYARITTETPRSFLGSYGRKSIERLNRENPGLNAPIPAAESGPIERDDV